ncbi:hypothetical protein [Tropicimonas sp. S265A]|uniref:hypothetical protein n=1 Tax=Tropicimonas sp. S265A TaxID=3415134 RepID=UPI003C7B182F
MRLRYTLFPAIMSLFAMSGCAPPEALAVDITPESRDAPRPKIAPLGPLLQAPDPRLTSEDADRLMARARAAQSRADAVR